MSMQDTREEKPEEPKKHHQERMRVIKVMAPTCYEFDPRRPPHAFELQVGFTHHQRGPTPAAAFESVDHLFQELPLHFDRQDLLPNLGRPFFFVEQVYHHHQQHPADVTAETFVPAGLGRSYRNLYESLDYVSDFALRETRASSTVFQLLAISAYHNQYSLDWLFEPTMTSEALAERLGFGQKRAPRSQRDVEAGRPAGSDPWACIADDAHRALDRRQNGDSRGSMHRQGDGIHFFYSAKLLPVDPKVRQLLTLPVSTLIDYMGGF